MEVMKEDYLLKRKNFSDHLSTMSREMYADTDFTDVTLVSEDMKQVKAHKTVLNAASPVMKELLMMFISSEYPTSLNSPTVLIGAAIVIIVNNRRQDSWEGTRSFP